MKNDVDSRPRLGYDDNRNNDQTDIEERYEEDLVVGRFEEPDETQDIEEKYEKIIFDRYIKSLVEKVRGLMKKNVDTFWKCGIVIGMKMNTTSERIKALSPVSGNPRSVESCLWHKDYNQFDRNGRSGG